MVEVVLVRVISDRRGIDSQSKKFQKVWAILISHSK